MTDDPIAKHLLDFIAEKESGGDYDIIFGEKPFSHARVLEMLTIAQVYDLQAGMLRGGSVSTAVGRYQFLRKTLAGLVDQAKVATSEPFTPKLQDRFGLMLLAGRGYGRWRAGNIDDATFAHNLSLEWASLPDPDNGGRSHYDGDSAGNHAARTLAEVYQAFSAARKAAESPALPPVPVPPSDIVVALNGVRDALMTLALALKGKGSP